MSLDDVMRTLGEATDTRTTWKRDWVRRLVGYSILCWALTPQNLLSDAEKHTGTMVGVPIFLSARSNVTTYSAWL